MKTEKLLMARYDARAVIPSGVVARDCFNLSMSKFHEKINSGETCLPLIRMEDSQKCAKGVHLLDLAAYIDQRRDDASRGRQGDRI